MNKQLKGDTMQGYRLHIRPLSAFATKLMGDTLFGQICWAIRNRFGETRLQECLQGYTDNQPFLVVSDAFPHGYLPRPHLPHLFFDFDDNVDRKALKKLHYLPIKSVDQPVEKWLDFCKTEQQAFSGDDGLRQEIQPHNTINRLTGTTGEGDFAPYSVRQNWYPQGAELDLYLLLDESRLAKEDLRQCLDDIADMGYGKDASIGMGKFAIVSVEAHDLAKQDQANACMTLANCAPQGLGYDAKRSFYQLFTRFGRHGDIAVHQKAKPFKNPILMASAGSVFTCDVPTTAFIGQGLGGDGSLSKTIEDTVHQGYAPCIAIHLPNRDTE